GVQTCALPISLSDSLRKLSRSVRSLTPAFFNNIFRLGHASEVSLSAYIHSGVYTDLSAAFSVSSSITARVTITKGERRRSITARLFRKDKPPPELSHP